MFNKREQKELSYSQFAADLESIGTTSSLYDPGSWYIKSFTCLKLLRPCKQWFLICPVEQLSEVSQKWPFLVPHTYSVQKISQYGPVRNPSSAQWTSLFTCPYLIVDLNLCLCLAKIHLSDGNLVMVILLLPRFFFLFSCLYIFLCVENAISSCKAIWCDRCVLLYKEKGLYKNLSYNKYVHQWRSEIIEQKNFIIPTSSRDSTA